MSDTALLEAVREEVSEIKVENKLTPEQPVSYQPRAWTRRGFAD